MHNLFVYGTLKAGYGNHRIIDGAILLGTAESAQPSYVMWGRGFPFIAESNHGHKVRGEIYTVSDQQLAHCDRLEGHPDWYRREQRTFHVNGLPVVAWVYLQPSGRVPAGICRQPVDGVLEWRPD